jgi:hypothetical protein
MISARGADAKRERQAQLSFLTGKHRHDCRPREQERDQVFRGERCDEADLTDAAILPAVRARDACETRPAVTR